MMTRRNITAIAVAALVLLCGLRSDAQSPADGVLVDQVIAVVNGDLVLESDVDQERRFAAFQAVDGSDSQFSRAEAVDRIIDRTLILQQARLQPDDRVTLEQAREQLKIARKEIPACAQYRCETDAGWQRFCHDQGFTVAEVEERERTELEMLRFIELRFRSGIRIEPEQIKQYYDTVLVPQEQKLKVQPPPLDTVSDRIATILLEQQVNNLLADWLKTLKAQGSVRVMKPGEVAP